MCSFGYSVFLFNSMILVYISETSNKYISPYSYLNVFSYGVTNHYHCCYYINMNTKVVSQLYGEDSNDKSVY